jgi:hypothetical protein
MGAEVLLAQVKGRGLTQALVVSRKRRSTRVRVARTTLCSCLIGRLAWSSKSK